MIRKEQPSESFKGIRAHFFNLEYYGEQPKGVWRVLGGGAGAKVEVGAEVIGHGHVHPAFVEQIIEGAQETYDTQDGHAVVVKLDQIYGLRAHKNGLIRQDGEEELGYLFYGKVMAVEQRLKMPTK